MKEDFEKFARWWVGPKEEFKSIVKYWNIGILNGEGIQRVHDPIAFSLQTILDLLEDKNPEIRERAVQVLAYRKETGVYNAIAKAAKKEESPIVKFAIQIVLRERKEQAHINVLFRIPAEMVR